MAGPEQESWENDPLVRALRAPGTSKELAGESEFVAAFRAEQRPIASVRRFGRRFGISATTAVTTVVLTAGVAAAYNQALPDPVQRFAHSVLGPVGVPAPAHPRPHPKADALVVQPTSPATNHLRSTPSPTATPKNPLPPSANPAGTPTANPSPTSGASTSTSPTPTLAPTTPVAAGVPPRVPAAVSISASASRVAAGNAVMVSGVVSASDGQTLRNRLVRLVARSGTSAWVLVVSGRTGVGGRIVLQSQALNQNTGLRLVTGNGVRSAIVHVVVVPVMTVTASAASGTTTVAMMVRGGQPGDAVAVFRRHNGVNVRIGTVYLDANGSAVFSLPTPKHQARIILRLLATRAHAQAQTGVTVGG